MKNCFVQKQKKRTFVNFGNDDAGKGAHSDIKKRDFSVILDSAVFGQFFFGLDTTLYVIEHCCSKMLGNE